MALIATASLTGCKSPTGNNDGTVAIDSTTIKTDTIKNKIDMPDTSKPVAKDTIKAPTITKKPLTLIFEGLSSPTAQVIMSLYTPANKFPDKKDRLKELRFTPAGLTLTVKLTDLEYGEYAIASFQDLRAEGEIHTNMIGIPVDPIAFSQNVHPKVKAPKFEDCKFTYDDNHNEVKMSMYKMIGK